MRCVCAAACSAEVDGDALGQSSDAIVRGTTENGRNYVVALRITHNLTDQNGDPLVGFCSGVLYAPRTVLTAAHCVKVLDANYQEIGHAVDIKVYFGNNYEQDLAALGPDLQIPPPPTASRFVNADSWDTHPAWNSTTLYADLAAVYLDRQPRLPPNNTIVDGLPLQRSRQNVPGQSITILGYGASVSLDSQGNEVEGAYVKRRGTSPFVGTPVINPLPPDPHPGILNTTVRNSLFQLNGNAPNSNSCAGDSGGPAVRNISGQDYVIGISTWGGNFCESFSYYTRIDPFLSFLDLAYQKGGQAPLTPRLECITPRPAGGYRAYFGYDNRNGVVVNVPYGANNSLPQDTGSLRPSTFAPGNHPYVFGLNFNAGQTLSYRLNPQNGPNTLLTVNQNSPRCNVNSRDFICAQACDASQAAACGESRETCVAACNDFYVGISPCEPAMDEYHRCVAQQPVSEFTCFDTFPFAFACSPYLDAVGECLSGG